MDERIIHTLWYQFLQTTFRIAALVRTGNLDLLSHTCTDKLKLAVVGMSCLIDPELRDPFGQTIRTFEFRCASKALYSSAALHTVRILRMRTCLVPSSPFERAA